MHHHTIKTKTGEINVLICDPLHPAVGEAMQKGIVIVAQSEKRAAEILARSIGVGIGEFKNKLAGDWQETYNYFNGEKG